MYLEFSGIELTGIHTVFFPDATSSWNFYISQFEYFPTYSCLKKYMISCHRPKGKPVFDIHDPTGIRYLFQLRLGLSHLRSHKKRYGFEDTPSDTCLYKTGIEDTHHFLLSCPFILLSVKSWLVVLVISY